MTHDEHLDLLAQAGYSVVPLGRRLLRIGDGELSILARVVPLQQLPSPAIINREIESAQRAGANVPLFLIPRINHTVRRAALRMEVAAVGIADRIVLVDGVITDLSEARREPRPGMRRRPWGRLAVARDIIRRGGRLSSQVATSRAIGISQPAVGKAIATLREAGLLPNDETRVLKRPQLQALVTYAIEQYPGPGGISTYWFGSRVTSAGLDLSALLADTDALISGDFAADAFAPWKQPRTLTIYAPHGVDLVGHGFAESSPKEANVILRVPEDPTIWLTAQEWTDIHPARFTDPLITAWELSESGDVDADQAVDRITQRILDEAGPS